ncbi:MAG: phosphoribosylamine--glycine ligase [Oscillospiraceae bacterium]|jgi:phosphoribosylamine--glycine ligase|nr:phosphoribosylamine--glycine ligase [Oscillospiraceae bacterium]
MKVLVIGSGGREHAICTALAVSARVTGLYCAPGNGGIALVANCVPVAATDVSGVVDFAKNNAIDYVVVAPDDPLALGMVDALEEAGIRAFGPRKSAAIIESSKIFSKDLMKKYGIPTAKYAVFTDLGAAEDYIASQKAPIVVKADGLALGKGVVVAQSTEEALRAAREMMGGGKFGAAGARIVVEECMTGPEVTVLAFADGKIVVPMLSSQDHKRAFDGDNGPNTGGMGAFCPSPNYTAALAVRCEREIFRPTLEAMSAEGRPFSGVLYFGLMLTPDGPRVIEYNARFGDPETQPILSMLDTDILDIFEAVTDGRLGELEIKWKSGAACCVVMASGGYPERYGKGFEISGLDNVPEDITVFHAGTKAENGKYYTNGGRVLGVTAHGADLPSAIARAYAGVAQISFENAHFRTDIGKGLVK